MRTRERVRHDLLGLLVERGIARAARVACRVDSRVVQQMRRSRRVSWRLRRVQPAARRVQPVAAQSVRERRRGHFREVAALVALVDQKRSGR